MDVCASKNNEIACNVCAWIIKKNKSRYNYNVYVDSSQFFYTRNLNSRKNETVNMADKILVEHLMQSILVFLYISIT